MRLLILGGTKFLGRAIVDAAIARDHTLTLFNRGLQDPAAYPNVEQVRGDRTRGFDGLGDRKWDAVVDTAAYLPRDVASSTRFFAPRVAHYTLVSSISVQASHAAAGQTESAPVARLTPEQEAEVAELSTDGPGIGSARIVREGNACALIAFGAMVGRCLEAASALAGEGIECAVLDLRSLVPLDVEAIAGQVRSTGRAVVVHEAPLTLGMGAEVVARIVEEAFDHLEAPVLRVTGPDVPYPPASLEQHFLPSVERIAGAVRTVVTY